MSISDISRDESAFKKATHDCFQYLVIVNFGGRSLPFYVAELIEHDDGFVTLVPSDSRPDGVEWGMEFGGQAVPCPRGISVRKERIEAVIDAPFGS